MKTEVINILADLADALRTSYKNGDGYSDFEGVMNSARDRVLSLIETERKDAMLGFIKWWEQTEIRNGYVKPERAVEDYLSQQYTEGNL